MSSIHRLMKALQEAEELKGDQGYPEAYGWLSSAVQTYIDELPVVPNPESWRQGKLPLLRVVSDRDVNQ